MLPILLDFGEVTLFGMTIPLRVGGYGFFYALACIVGWLLFRHLGRTIDRDKPWTDIYFMSLIAGVMGGRLVNGLTRLPDLLSGRITLLDVFAGGGIWLAGTVLGVGTYLWLCRRSQVPIGVGANIIFTVIPLAHGIGRIGCLLGGCCYGAPTDLPWGITYTNELAHRMMGTPLHVPLHPSPVYEFLLEFTLFVAVFILWRRGPRPWATPVVWCGAYGVARFFLEFVRADYRGSLLVLSTSQWISLGIVAAAIALYFGPLKRRLLDLPSASRIGATPLATRR